MKVLYTDTFSTPTSADNVNGMLKAYRKVVTLEPFDYRRLAKEHGVTWMNEMLVETALRFCPDLIHLGKCEQIRGSTIKAIKERLDTCVIHFYGDFRWTPQPWVVDIGKYADYTLFNNDDARCRGMYEAVGVKHVGSWWGCGTDPEVFYPRKAEKDWDLVFAGSNVRLPQNKGYETRRQLLEAILDAGFCLHVFGNVGGWRYLEECGDIHLHPFIVGNGLATAYSRTKITLGVNGVNDVHMYASWRRAVNAMASGTFHLTHYVPGIETFFENGKHLVWFTSVPEAVELVKYYLTHREEREEIAAAGRQEVLARHTWDVRIAQMIGRVPQCVL